MTRVVVTGIGAVTPLGNTFLDAWGSLLRGQSGVGTITRFDASALSWKIAGEVREFDPSLFLSTKEVIRLDPFIHYAAAASAMAVSDAGLSPSHPLIRTASVLVGSSRGGISTIERALVQERISAFTMPSSPVSMAGSIVAEKLGIIGPSIGISNACASGANAIGEAFRMIKSGLTPIAVAGGTEAPICRLCIEGYGVAGALTKRMSAAPRPFDRNHEGFVLGEGACVLIMEEHGHALRRGARIYGEIIGYGCSSDAFHMTRPSSEGEARAMQAALEDAGVSPEEIGHINTHGTATPAGDEAEAEAIAMVFGERASDIPATAVKSMSGHMIAASGAFEAAVTLMTLQEGMIPQTLNLKELDPACKLNVMTVTRVVSARYAITNSFGFGGVNAVLVLARQEG